MRDGMNARIGGGRRIACVAIASVLAVGLLAAAGCSRKSTGPLGSTLVPFNEEQRALMAEARNAEYRLRVGDVLSVDFKYQNDLDTRDVLVLPDGRITLRGVEGLPAAGQTLSRLDSTLTAHFAREYRNPDLSISVLNLGQAEIYVLGEVRSPGMRSMPNHGGGVLQAVAMAGGFTEDAEPDETVLIRVMADGYLFRQIELGDMEKGLKDPGALMDLQPYDIIYVPRNAIGDFAYFTNTVLGSALRYSDLFWDIYALANIDKVDRILR